MLVNAISHVLLVKSILHRCEIGVIIVNKFEVVQNLNMTFNKVDFILLSQ